MDIYHKYYLSATKCVIYLVNTALLVTVYSRSYSIERLQSVLTVMDYMALQYGVSMEALHHASMV